MAAIDAKLNRFKRIHLFASSPRLGLIFPVAAINSMGILHNPDPDPDWGCEINIIPRSA